MSTIFINCFSYLFGETLHSSSVSRKSFSKFGGNTGLLLNFDTVYDIFCAALLEYGLIISGNRARFVRIMDDSLIHIHAKKFGQVWEYFQNGYRPPIYDPGRVAGFDDRRTSLTLNIPVRQPEIIQEIRRVTSSLRGLPGVYVMPEDYYHITVKWLGFFKDQKKKEYDIEPEVLDLIIEQVERIISQIPPFVLRLKRVNGLGSFIIFEVSDNGAIAHLQGRFHEDATCIPVYPLEGEEWLPHLSIAGIKTLDSIEPLKQRAHQFREIEIGTIQVEEIYLSQAILQEPSPVCTSLHSFRLSSFVP
jgi:2'-5' RNA ligase